MNKSSGMGFKDINQGPGVVFLGTANASFDANTLEQIGTHGPDGVTVDYNDSFYEHKDANGRTIVTEIVGQEAEIKFDCLQVNQVTWDKLFGTGSWSSAIAGTVAFTDLPVTLYGNDFSHLPWRNVTITAADDGAATPTSYVVADDIEYDNDNTAANNDGMIRRKVGGDITYNEQGTTIYVTGTYTVNARKTWTWDAASTTDYFGMRIKKRNRDGQCDIYDFWKVQRVGKIEPIAMKAGQPYKLGITFKVLQDLAKENLGQIIHEVPTTSTSL